MVHFLRNLLVNNCAVQKKFLHFGRYSNNFCVKQIIWLIHSLKKDLLVPAIGLGSCRSLVESIFDVIGSVGTEILEIKYELQIYICI